MKKINIQNEANIKAEGKRSCHRCKPIICIETGDVFSSMMDAAEHIGCTESAVSAHLCGKSHSVKGKHFCYLSRVNESLDAIITRLRETAAVESDAKKWQAHQAEQEAIRKAEERRLEEERKAREKHEAAVAKARAKIEKLTENCNKLEAKLLEEERMLMEAQDELATLMAA